MAKTTLTGINGLFDGMKVIDNNKQEYDLGELCKGKSAVGLYFSAHWCPPCRGFTPQLAQYYKKFVKSGQLEIIFISSDRDQQSFDDYFAEMPWKALPFAARDLTKELGKKYGVSGIPSLIILKPDGTEVTKEGRSDVTNNMEEDRLPDKWTQ